MLCNKSHLLSLSRRGTCGWLLGLGLALFVVSPASATVHVVDCVNGPNLTISNAVGVAVNGDTILVRSCVYNESVVITGFDRLSLIAAGPAQNGSYTTGVGTLPAPSVVVDSAATGGSCFRVSASSNVTISGFQMQNCDTYGILSDGEFNAFHGNRVQSCGFNGINDSGLGTKITGNIVAFNGQAGILLENATLAEVADNRVAFNNEQGIFVFGEFNHVVNNEVTNNGREGLFVGGAENRIERNTCQGNAGAAEIFVDFGSSDADVVGNFSAGSLVDNGVSTELMDNF